VEGIGQEVIVVCFDVLFKKSLGENEVKSQEASVRITGASDWTLPG
jgi:hypothetical protein